MKFYTFPIVLVLCLIILTSAAMAEGEVTYPYLDADLYFHALLVHQENFAVAGGLFGDSMAADTGNFNSDVDEDFDQMIESRFRFFMNAHMHEQVLGRFTLELNPEYGRERGFGDFRVNNGGSGTGELRFKHFYVEVNHPVGGTLGYRVGRQGFSTPQSLVVGDPDAEGITAWYKNKKAGTFIVAAAAADTNDTREIEDIYTHFRYDATQLQPWMGLTLYGSMLVVRDLTAGPFNAPPEINAGGGSNISEFLFGPSNIDMASKAHAELYWAGINLRRTSGDFNTELNFVTSFGNLHPADPEELGILETNRTKLKRAFGVLGMIDLSYGRKWYRTGIAGAYVSGHDPDPDTEIYTGYLDVDADFTFTRFFFDGGPYLVSTGFASPSVQGSGLIAAKYYFFTNPTHWLAVNTQLALLNANSDRPQYDVTMTEIGTDTGLFTENVDYRSYSEDAGRFYGTEFNLWLEFSPIKRVVWLIEFDYFQPGDYFAGTATETDPGNGFLESPDPAYRVATGFLFR